MFTNSLNTYIHVYNVCVGVYTLYMYMYIYNYASTCVCRCVYMYTVHVQVFLLLKSCKVFVSLEITYFLSLVMHKLVHRRLKVQILSNCYSCWLELVYWILHVLHVYTYMYMYICTYLTFHSIYTYKFEL